MTYQAFDYMLMFVANFATVFLLGLQSRNVVAGRYAAAVITSFGISVANFTFVRFAASGGLDVFAFCAIGGCLGIAFSIWFYNNVLHRKVEDKQITVTPEVNADPLEVAVSKLRERGRELDKLHRELTELLQRRQ